jgi:hypothetical protein
MDICGFKHLLEILSVILAIAAAAWWFAAAWVGRASFLNTKIDDFDRILRRQSQFNAIAALCAACAAIAQLVVLLGMPVCRAFA